MRTNLQACVQLAQINIAVLTNVLTSARWTETEAEFPQPQHLQATGKEVPSRPGSYHSQALGTPSSRLPHTQIPNTNSTFLSFSLMV